MFCTKNESSSHIKKSVYTFGPGTHPLSSVYFPQALKHWFSTDVPILIVTKIPAGCLDFVKKLGSPENIEYNQLEDRDSIVVSRILRHSSNSGGGDDMYKNERVLTFKPKRILVLTLTKKRGTPFFKPYLLCTYTLMNRVTDHV